MTTDETPPLSTALYRACEAVGAFMELWGFKRIHGMVWMYMFLQPQPVSAAEIKGALGISSGLVSMTLQELGRWDVVHRKSEPGERRDFYRAETNIARPIIKVLRERELYQIGAMLDTLRDVHASLAGDRSPEMAYARGQIEVLLRLGGLGQELFSQFLEAGTLLMRGQLTWRQAPEKTGQLLLALKRLLSTQGEADAAAASASPEA